MGFEGMNGRRRGGVLWTLCKLEVLIKRIRRTNVTRTHIEAGYDNNVSV